MSTVPFFDTYDAIKKLIAAGCSERQAEAQVKMQVDAYVSLREEQDTIKKDLHALKINTDKIKTDMDHEFALVRREMAHLDVKFTGKFNLLYWMFGALLATTLGPLLANGISRLYPLIFH